MTLRTMFSLSLPIIVACTGDPGAGPVMTFQDGPQTEAADRGALTFGMTGGSVTSCGLVSGLRVDVTDPLGTPQTCTRLRSAAGAMPECAFTGPTGRWAIDAVAVLGPNARPLECCAASLPPITMVTAEATTAVGAVMSCRGATGGPLVVDGWAYPSPPPDDEVVPQESPSSRGSAEDERATGDSTTGEGPEAGRGGAPPGKDGKKGAGKKGGKKGEKKGGKKGGKKGAGDGDRGGCDDD